MTPLIFIALATLVGLPPHTGRLAPASATKTTAKTPRDGPTARGVLAVVSVALAGAKRSVCDGRPTRAARAIKMSGVMRPPSG